MHRNDHDSNVLKTIQKQNQHSISAFNYYPNYLLENSKSEYEMYWAPLNVPPFIKPNLLCSPEIMNK